MSDPLRTDLSRVQDDRSEPDRTAKIEQLLLDGLDHYFAAEYEQAINVWTRALFLDRSHARARAYIERARAALAERQRQSEELLHSGVAAFDRGESLEARRLLEDAIRSGAPTEEALAVLSRLDRMDMRPLPGRPINQPRDAQRPLATASPAATRKGRPWGWFGVLSLAAGVAVVTWLATGAAVEWMLPSYDNPAHLPPAPVSGNTSIPIPLRGELAVSRARSLAASGRLHDAIAALDQVRTTDAQRAEADRLKGELQRQLIEFGPSAPSPAPTETPQP